MWTVTGNTWSPRAASGIARTGMRANGCTFRGKHHEIYLGDPRRADPAKLKTALRYPVG